MKLGKGVPSVWPGYVAAIASLVLSLLLLLAILVFAMAQVENMVAKYSAQIMRNALEEELESAVQTQPAPAQTSAAPRAPAPARAPAVVQPPQPVPTHQQPPAPSGETRDIRLVFESGAFELTAQDAAEIQEAIRRAGKPAGTRWLISASVLESDAVSERTTYRLMSQVHKTLAAGGLDQKHLDMRLRKSSTPVEGRERGEIVIYLLPQKDGAVRESP